MSNKNRKPVTVVLTIEQIDALLTLKDEALLEVGDLSRRQIVLVHEAALALASAADGREL